jgi:hypothetical protein
MPAAWQACPHCKVLHSVPEGGAPRTHCPACRRPMQKSTAEVPAILVAARATATTRPTILERRHPYELWLALLAIVVVTALYALVSWDGMPRPSGFIGHSLGIIGFLLMCATETLYSLRKRIHGFALGKMSTWLQVHIFTGILGPYFVLLHSAGKFHGLAGILTVLTLAMVVSGFIGRYLYTAVPRTVDGVEVAGRELESQIASTDRELQALGINLAGAAPVRQSGWMLVLGRVWLSWRERWRMRRTLHNLDASARPHAARLERLLTQRYRLQLQIGSLAAARRLMALWHVAHIPLGVVVFTFALIHIVAAMYYGTLLR